MFIGFVIPILQLIYIYFEIKCKDAKASFFITINYLVKKHRIFFVLNTVTILFNIFFNCKKI